MSYRTKLLWIGLVLANCFAIAWECAPLKNSSERLAKFSSGGVMVESKEIPLTPAEKTNFVGVQIMKRAVSVGKESVIATVVDGTRNRHAIHDPVDSFREVGWQVVAQETMPMQRGEARLLRLAMNQNTAAAICWYSDGLTQFTSPREFWWKAVLRRLSFGSSGPEPLQVILFSSADVAPNWTELLRAWPQLQDL